MNFLDFSYDPKYIKIALYCKKGIPTHAAIQIDENFWESKIGTLGIIKKDFEYKPTDYEHFPIYFDYYKKIDY